MRGPFPSVLFYGGMWVLVTENPRSHSTVLQTFVPDEDDTGAYRQPRLTFVLEADPDIS